MCKRSAFLSQTISLPVWAQLSMNAGSESLTLCFSSGRADEGPSSKTQGSHWQGNARADGQIPGRVPSTHPGQVCEVRFQLVFGFCLCIPLRIHPKLILVGRGNILEVDPITILHFSVPLLFSSQDVRRGKGQGPERTGLFR